MFLKFNIKKNYRRLDGSTDGPRDGGEDDLLKNDWFDAWGLIFDKVHGFLAGVDFDPETLQCM